MALIQLPSRESLEWKVSLLIEFDEKINFQRGCLFKIKWLQVDVLPSANSSLEVVSLSDSSGIQSSKCDFRVSLSSIKPIPCDDQLRSLIPDAYFPSKMEHSLKCNLMVFAVLIRCFAQMVKHSWLGSLKSCAML